MLKPALAFMRIPCNSLVLMTCCWVFVLADGPADNLSSQVRPIPPDGIPLSAEQSALLETELTPLQDSIHRARRLLKEDPNRLRLLADVEVFASAVEIALTHQEIYDPEKALAQAQEQLILAKSRLEHLLNEGPSWLQQTGLIPRGYQSRIDDSIQPYGLLIPHSWKPGTARPSRLDIWFHGRGEKLTELDFLHQLMHQPGTIQPENAIVLHLYGRYCNANKFAGEMDLFEALDQVKKDYLIDDNRIVVRGFSMGGAACWQFATHYAGQWAAAAPGAGFSETREFLEFFQKEDLNPFWWEKRLWNLYDATVYAENLFHCPTVAYSGAVDRQKQAADIMSRFMEREGLELTHLIGPDTAHKYHPETKMMIEERLDAILELGRNPLPKKIRFTTYTLAHPQMHWIHLQGLEEHWQRARIAAEVVSDQTIHITTRNITAFDIQMTPGSCPMDPTQSPVLHIDGQSLQAPRPQSDRSWQVKLTKQNEQWMLRPEGQGHHLRKKPGLQGPIDDAFMDRFLMVGPGSWPMNAGIGDWVSKEMAHALTHWRQQFRGSPRFKLDHQVTPEDLKESHLILWGDPASNRWIRQILKALPITWDQDAIKSPTQQWDANYHVPVMIYPNPLNPEKYVVINSGFTYREYDYLNNARQVPKLPDWAVIDVRTPPSPRWPGAIADAGFFDEQWQWKNHPPVSNHPTSPAP
ncbi:MAG: prolyl oligopeptidase family serine peptidase [Limisphaerales bacterium]